MTVFLSNLNPKNFVGECFTVIRKQRVIFRVITSEMNIIALLVCKKQKICIRKIVQLLNKT